jgi:hypothetical protein
MDARGAFENDGFVLRRRLLSREIVACLSAIGTRVHAQWLQEHAEEARKHDSIISDSGFRIYPAPITRESSGSSSGGFVAPRMAPFANGLPTCSNVRSAATSTLGRGRRVLASRSSLFWISFPVHYFGTRRAHSRRIPRRWTWRSKGLRSVTMQLSQPPWEKTFFFLPLGHSEDLSHVQKALRLAEELVEPAPPEFQKILQHSASQARGHRDVIARFGRHPHRNAILGRQSTPEELEYLARGEFVHTREVPK